MRNEVYAVILEVQLVEVLAVSDFLCAIQQIHICVGHDLGGRDLDGQLRHIAGREPRLSLIHILLYYAAYDSPFYVLSAGFRCYAAYCGTDQPLAPEGTADRRHYSADFGDCGLCSNVQIFHQVCHLCNQ